MDAVSRVRVDAVVKYHALVGVLRDHVDEIHDEEYRRVIEVRE